MGWTPEQQRAKRAEKAAEQGRTVRSWKRLKPSESTPSSSASGSATSAVPPKDPAEGADPDGPADRVRITADEAVLLGNVLRDIRECAAKAAEAQESATEQAQLQHALATTVTAPADVRSSVLRRLQHAHAHWQARKDFVVSVALPSYLIDRE